MSFWGTRAVFGALVLALLASCASSDSSREPEFSSAPYVLVGWGQTGVTAAAEATPARRYVLSFLVAHDGQCEPVWGTGREIRDPALRSEIDALREAGGAITVSSGGALGTYLENTCDTAEGLADAYHSALEATGADWLDVDIEQDVPVDRVADAVALVHERSDVTVSATVKVLGDRRGLEPSALRLLQELAHRDVDVVVNAMVMNFPAGDDWQTAMLTAAETVTDQIERIWSEGDRDAAYRRLGLTYMAGRNDTGVVTTLDDAHALRDYATAHSIGFLGFWSLGRDNGNCPGHAETTNKCSGIKQENYAFTRSLA